MAEQRKRGPNKISNVAEKALERVQQMNAAYSIGAAKVQLDAAQMIRDRMTELELERERAIYAAILAGVPKSRIHREGLGTTNPNYVYDVQRRWEAKEQTFTVEATAAETRYMLGHVSYNDASGNAVFWVLDIDEPERKTMAPNGETHNGWLVWERGGSYTTVNGTTLPVSLHEWLDAGVELPTVEAEPNERGGVQL